MVKYTIKTQETGYCSLKMRSRCSKPAAAASQLSIAYSNYFFHFRYVLSHTFSLTLETDTRACADVYSDGSPLSLLILDGAHCSRLWWKRSGEYCFIFSHLLILHVPTWPALSLFFSSPDFLFFTPLFVFFFLCCQLLSVHIIDLMLHGPSSSCN